MSIPDLQAREQLERQLDELCDRYLRTPDKETQKQIIELRKYPDDLNENQQSLTISVGFVTKLSRRPGEEICRACKVRGEWLERRRATSLLTRNRGVSHRRPVARHRGGWPDGYEHSPVNQLPSEENLYPVSAIVFWL